MSKEKDPAFLFYPQRWLEGTAELSATARGIYINLLSHQHQKKGSLPCDTKVLARLGAVSESEFLSVWESELKVKFQQNGDKLSNKTLNKITNKRATTAATRKVAGKLSNLLKTISHLPPEVSEEIKSRFKSEDYVNCADDLLDGLLTDWFNVCLKSIININIDEVGIDKGGVGEKDPTKFPLATDFNGLPEIYIGQSIQYLDITKQVKLKDHDVIGLWEIFKIKNLTGKKYYRDVSDVYSHFIDHLKYLNFDNAHKSSTNSVAKLGTSEARIKKAREW